MDSKNSSRKRMLDAIDCKVRQPEETPPCSFMLFKGLWAESSSYLDFLHRQVDLGLDVYAQIPPRQPGIQNDYYNLHGLPVNHDPAVETREWLEHPDDQATPILIKEYGTPKGILRTEVRRTEDWPYGDRVPFLDNYLVPRSHKFLIETNEDIEALQYLLVNPSAQDVQDFQDESQPLIDYAREMDLMLAGGWGVGADLIGWVYGLTNMLYSVFDNPEFIRRLLGIIGDWNRVRMKVMLDMGIDLFIKRPWYENCDFWSPKTYQEFIVPEMMKDVTLAHEYGTNFGYLITSNVMPLLDQFAELEIDVLIGVDPLGWDLEKTKEILEGKVCLWGGINGHLTVEQGTPKEVREEVRHALDLFSPGTGFILSPVDNIRDYNQKGKGNVRALIDEWQKQL